MKSTTEDPKKKKKKEKTESKAISGGDGDEDMPLSERSGGMSTKRSQ